MTDAPSAPYVGIRAYGFDEHSIFTGRDVDIEQVGHLVANRARWRIVLLHGQTGCGKSSFLRAGLIPILTSRSGFDTTVYRRDDLGAASQFIVSSADPMLRIAEVAVELLRQHLGDADQADWLGRFDLEPDLDRSVRRLADSSDLMARWFAELALRLQRPLLLVIDQAEEVFTLRDDPPAAQARGRYFDFLSAHCEHSSWIQFMISMRTEFYGRFDNELRQRIGPEMPVAPYYLEPFLVQSLTDAVTEAQVHRYRQGGEEYSLAFEHGLPQRIVTTIAESFPGLAALTCLQIVCVRLWQQALRELLRAHDLQKENPTLPRDRAVVITHKMFDAIGIIENVLEDVVDQAIGDFCDVRELNLLDSECLWRATKLVLGTLVTQQPGAAPTTKFIERSRFVEDLTGRMRKSMSPLALKLIAVGQPARTVGDYRQDANQLVEHLLRPDVRVLREVQTLTDGSGEPTRFLALGHDVLCVGLVEAMARVALLNERQAAEIRRFIFSMIGWPVAAGALGSAVAYFVRAEGLNISDGGLLGAMLGFYGIFFVEFVRKGSLFSLSDASKVAILLDTHLASYKTASATKRRRSDSVHAFVLPFLLVRDLGRRFPSMGALFRAFTASARERTRDQGAVAFVKGPRQ